MRVTASQRLGARILGALYRAETIVANAALAAIGLLLLTDVGLRMFTQTSLQGAQRISVYLMILIGFLGIGLASARSRHLRPRFADGLVPPIMRNAAGRLADATMALVWLGLCWFGILFVLEAREFQDIAHVISIPLWPLYLVVPYTFASTAFRHVVFAFYPMLRPIELPHE